MSKIQLSTIKQTCDVQVINVNAYLIAKVVKAHLRVSDAIENAKQIKRKWDDDDKKWKEVLDENGNNVIEYCDISGEMIHKEVLPLLKEFVDAFEAE